MFTDTRTLSRVLAEAASRGTDVGTSAAEWCSGPDAETPAWLSGEWAGESITELLGDLLSQVSEEYHDDVCDAYCDAADEAFASAPAPRDLR